MTPKRRILLLSSIAILLGAAVLSAAYLAYARGGTTGTLHLPPGCVKPQGGYLIIAGVSGFNDSVDRGVPAANWPVIDVQKGANVTIRVCNADQQPHGFQVAHYYDSRTVAVASGQVLTVSFVANDAGTFKIYCSIICSVHWAMVSGRLTVS